MKNTINYGDKVEMTKTLPLIIRSGSYVRTTKNLALDYNITIPTGSLFTVTEVLATYIGEEYIPLFNIRQYGGGIYTCVTGDSITKVEGV